MKNILHHWAFNCQKSFKTWECTFKLNWKHLILSFCLSSRDYQFLVLRGSFCVFLHLFNENCDTKNLSSVVFHAQNNVENYATKNLAREVICTLYTIDIFQPLTPP